MRLPSNYGRPYCTIRIRRTPFRYPSSTRSSRIYPAHPDVAFHIHGTVILEECKFFVHIVSSLQLDRGSSWTSGIPPYLAEEVVGSCDMHFVSECLFEYALLRGATPLGDCHTMAGLVFPRTPRSSGSLNTDTSKPLWTSRDISSDRATWGQFVIDSGA